eukprot:g3542.t1
MIRIYTHFFGYVPYLNVAQVIMESHEVKKYVVEHKERFMLKQQKKDDHGKIMKDSHGKPLLENILSNEKIYIFLWSKPSAVGIDTAAFCHALEYMIVYSCTQSDTERSGKKVGEILTTNRSLLKDVEVEKLLFLEENLPFLHEINLDKLVDRYITWSTKKGRRLKSPILETSFNNFKTSEVLARLKKRKSMGFLYK